MWHRIRVSDEEVVDSELAGEQTFSPATEARLETLAARHLANDIVRHTTYQQYADEWGVGARHVRTLSSIAARRVRLLLNGPAASSRILATLDDLLSSKNEDTQLRAAALYAKIRGEMPVATAAVQVNASAPSGGIVLPEAPLERIAFYESAIMAERKKVA